MIAPEEQQYQQYLPPLNQSFPNYVPSKVPYADDEMSPFSMSYASMAGAEAPYSSAYQEPMIHVRPPFVAQAQRARTFPTMQYVNHGADGQR